MKGITRKLTYIPMINDRLIVLVLSSLVIIAGVFYSFHLGDDLRYPDEHRYFALAKNLSFKQIYSFDGKQPTTSRPPGYPLLLSLFVSFGANLPTLRLLNFISLGFSIYLIHLILKNISSQFKSFLGALLIVCYPVLFYTAGTLYPQTTGSFALLSILLVLSRPKMNSLKPFFLIGLLFGYLILAIPIFILCLILVIAWILLFMKERKIKATLTIVLTSCLMLSIWSARNYIVFKEYIFISSNSGLNLLLGNSENTTPNAGTNVDISNYKLEASNLNHINQDKYYRSKAIEFIINHKRWSLILYLKKFLNYFNYKNEMATKTEGSFMKNLIMLMTYGPLLLLFVLRIFLMRQFKISKFEFLLISLYISSGLFYAIFFTRIRFRLPFDILLIIVVSMFLSNVLRTLTITEYNTSIRGRKYIHSHRKRLSTSSKKL
jgi:4-amino-4-deoxy-L-arabinose transferase-like glycosyltransferase